MTPTPSSERDELDTVIESITGKAATEAFMAIDPALELRAEIVAEGRRFLDEKRQAAKAAIHHQTQIAQVRYALEVLQLLKRSNRDITSRGVWKFVGTERGRLLRILRAHHRLAEYLDTAIQAQQKRLDELTNAPKGIGESDARD